MLCSSRQLGMVSKAGNFLLRCHNHTEHVHSTSGTSFRELKNLLQERVMGLNELATYSTRVQKRSIFLWRWMKSFLGVTRKLRSLKTKLIENSEDYPEHRIGEPKSPDKGNSNPPPKLKAIGRRSAICPGLEEEHLCFGIPPLVLRKELIVQSMLRKLKLLYTPFETQGGGLSKHYLLKSKPDL